MAHLTRAVAQGVLDGQGVTQHEIEQLAWFYLQHTSEPVAAPAQVTDATLEACCKVVRDLSSDVRHSMAVDGYNEPQRRFLGSIADRIESAALLGGAVALRAAQPDAGGVVVDEAMVQRALAAFSRAYREAQAASPRQVGRTAAGVVAALKAALAGQQKGGGR